MSEDDVWCVAHWIPLFFEGYKHSLLYWMVSLPPPQPARLLERFFVSTVDSRTFNGIPYDSPAPGAAAHSHTSPQRYTFYTFVVRCALWVVAQPFQYCYCRLSNGEWRPKQSQKHIHAAISAYVRRSCIYYDIRRGGTVRALPHTHTIHPSVALARVCQITNVYAIYSAIVLFPL